MIETYCSIPHCAWPAEVRGWCRRHYLRWYRHGDPEGGRPVVLEEPPPENWREHRRKTERSNHLGRTYGITPADYEAMLIAQGGACAICGGQQMKKFRHFDVDHDKITGAVRGLLCRRCNTGLGYIEAGFAEKAAPYLEGSP